MIFCGDTVFPIDFRAEQVKGCSQQFISSKKIVNLESLIRLEHADKTTTGIGLYSSSDVTHFLNSLNVVSVSLANNHITDFDLPIYPQKQFLLSEGIDSFGAGDNLSEAVKPFRYIESNQKFVVLSFGWDVIGCRYATHKRKGVNPMIPKNVFEQIQLAQANDPTVNIILLFHANYEFELYPQPAHRRMFFDLIDKGVSTIICHHPHIVGGCEIYKGKPIFYSLGNFYLPELNYDGYDLSYREEAKYGLCVDYKLNIEDIVLYWTYKDENNSLSILKVEPLVNSDKLDELTPFKGMNDKEYITWFEKNRKKNKLLPIYKNYISIYERITNGLFVKFRQVLIDFLVRFRLK